MRIITIVSLCASAALGLGALFVAKTVLPNAAAAKAMAAGVAPQAGAPMVVAARDIKYGDKLDAGMLKVAKVPAGLVPQGAFTSVQQVLGQDGGGPPVALAPISAREPLMPAKLSGPGARASVAAEIAEGMRAYTIKVTDVSGVGGHALPGDHVDVVLMRDLTPDGPQRTLVSYIVLQNVRVLGVDLNADLASNKPASPNTATLEVSVPDSQKLSVAATLGELSLALRPTGAAELEAARPMSTGDFLGGGMRPRRTTAAAGPRRTASASAPLIVIVEGDGSGRSRSRARPSRAAPEAAPAPEPAPANPATGA